MHVRHCFVPRVLFGKQGHVHSAISVIDSKSVFDFVTKSGAPTGINDKRCAIDMAIRIQCQIHTTFTLSLTNSPHMRKYPVPVDFGQYFITRPEMKMLDEPVSSCREFSKPKSDQDSSFCGLFAKQLRIWTPNLKHRLKSTTGGTNGCVFAVEADGLMLGDVLTKDKVDAAALLKSMRARFSISACR